MTTEVGTLINQGRVEEVWQRFCGFLDLTMDEFMAMQERLLHEQIQMMSISQLGRAFWGDHVPASTEEFRLRVPLTDYEDYLPYLSDRREDALSEKPVAWAHTSGRSGEFKWVPYTARQFKLLGETMFTVAILSNARGRGDVRPRPGDTVVYNLPARPYTTGYALFSLAEIFDFRFLPPIETTEAMTFEERIATSFKMALRTGVADVGSISSVLMRLAEGFASGANSVGFDRTMLHPVVLWRVGRAVLRSKIERRPLLPRDLWRIKGLVVGGTDTDIYRERLAEYWGCAPHESYGCTEAPNVMATSIWTHHEMYFLPHVCFYEFIPEEEWVKTRQDAAYTPFTVLLDQVQPGKRYEVVITNFYGGAFLRYRTHDLVRFISASDEQNGIKLPAMIFDGRDGDIIDLAGFTGIIDEAMLWHALEDTRLPYEEWFVRKEVVSGGHPGLHLYIEMKSPVSDEEIRDKVHRQLVQRNPFYGDLAKMFNYMPMTVTQVPRGTFLRYLRVQQAAGADLSHWKPRHINPPEGVRDAILGIVKDLS